MTNERVRKACLSIDGDPGRPGEVVRPVCASGRRTSTASMGTTAPI